MKQSEFDTSEIKEKLIYYVLSVLRTESEPSDGRLKEIISEVISIDAKSANLSLEDKRNLAQSVFNSLRRLDVIEPLMEDPEVTEIMVNGPDRIFYEKAGKLYKSDIRFKDASSLTTVISCFFANRQQTVKRSKSHIGLKASRRLESQLCPATRCT